MTVDELSSRLHEINVLDMTGNTVKATMLVEALNQELTQSHLICLWAHETNEWAVTDALLFEREEN